MLRVVFVNRKKGFIGRQDDAPADYKDTLYLHYQDGTALEWDYRWWRILGLHIPPPPLPQEPPLPITCMVESLGSTASDD